MQLAEVVGALSSQLYYPLEHIAWAADNQLLPCIQSHWFWTMDTILWGISLLVTGFQAVATIQSISVKLRKLRTCSSGETSTTSSAAAAVKKRVTFEDQQSGSSKTRIRVLRYQRFMAMLTVLQTLSDLMNAVHWLPEGFLWSGKLTCFWVGLFGTVSSVIGLYKVLPSSPHW